MPKLNAQQATEFIAEQHKIYYEKLSALMMSLAGKRIAIPRYTITDAVFRHCGQYTPATHTCQYSLPYCVYAGTHYGAIVAH